MPSSSLFDALERVVDHVPHPFMAPILDADLNTVVSIQDGIRYAFRFRGAQPDFYNFRPTDSKNARIISVALPSHVANYLNQLERFMVIAIFPVSHSTYVCIPYNASDASQRGWLNGEPKMLHLCPQLHPMTVVDARYMLGSLIYNTPSHLDIDIQSREAEEAGSKDWQNARSMLFARRAEIQKALHRQRLAERQRTTEDKVRFQLEFMGAELLDMKQGDRDITVTWDFDGHVHTATLTRAMRGMSVGFCVAGTEGQHNLSSLVEVIQEGRRRHRFDIPEESWL